MFKEYTSEDEKLIKKVGETVRFLRKGAKLSQFQLGVKAEIPKNQVGRIERGEINTSLVTLGRIATALEVNISELFNKTSKIL
nr:helix-turn-helix transcriptional regulator [uncultured Allomuricauda sp.]